MAKILLVEDNAANGDMLSRRLRRSGYEVVSAADGEAAVTMAAAECPDLILMDLNLPVLDGWAATRRIKGAPETRTIPVIALTAHAMREDRERAVHAGCDDYESKPVNLSRLLGKIATHLKAGGADAGARDGMRTAAPPVRVAEPPRNARPAPAATNSPTTADGRLLIVDDTPANRDMLARRLARAGYSVEVAADGTEALRRVGETAFDLILLDIMMPDVSGLDVLDVLRRTHPATDLPVIMATALGASTDVVNALEHGANDYVTKPLDFAVVLARVQTQLALKRSIDQIRLLERGLAERNRELQVANMRMKADLDAAVKVQAALLPSASPPVPGYDFAWLFRPSAELAGDIFNVFRLDDRYVGLYVLDVSGHGVAAALLSVTVSRFLFPIPDPTSLLWERTAGGEQCRLTSPARVAERLSERFPFDNTTSQYFTLVYGLLDLHEHCFRYVSAGHPQIVHQRVGHEPILLEASGFPVGVGPGEYDEYSVNLTPGDRLYIYSDGVPETMNPEGELFGCSRMLEALCGMVGAHVGAGPNSSQRLLHRLSAAVQSWSGLDRGQDDQTVLCVERRSSSG
jgi:phosphoserine phosphatase RsbU/P